MSDLVAWLTKILDEDEEIAHEAFRAGFDDHTPTGEHWGVPHAIGRHMLQHEPAAALADIAAKRAIIALHSVVETHIAFADGSSGDYWCDMCGNVDDTQVAWPCPTLRLLASTYADRSGYDDNWKP